MAGRPEVEPEEIRHQGAGQLLGRVLNAEALEVAGPDRRPRWRDHPVRARPGAAGAGPGRGAAGRTPCCSLAWLALALWLWPGATSGSGGRGPQARLEMTHDLVEQMVGHRTRLAQQSADRWHDGRTAPSSATSTSRPIDRRAAQLLVLIPRGWLLVSLLALRLPFVSGGASAGALAVSLGGALFAYWSFWKMVRGLADLAEAAVAWDQVGADFPRRRPQRESGARAAVLLAVPRPRRRVGEPVVVEAHDLVFRYGERAEPALAGCTLTIERGRAAPARGPLGRRQVDAGLAARRPARAAVRPAAPRRPRPAHAGRGRLAAAGAWRHRSSRRTTC